MAQPPGALEQLKSFGRVFWVSNLIEMCERLAYYGLRTVLPVYMLLALEQDGPQFDNIQKGSIYAIWAAISSFVPVFSGGYADRFGFRITIAISMVLDIAGFLTMAYAKEAASLFTHGASDHVPGHAAVYNFFLLGACLLALGTAVFKPGIQGLIATQITKETGSFAWSIFYQVVNIGGFLGPILAGFMRVLTWKYVFFACATIAATNLLWLLLVKEPALERKKASIGEFGLVALRGIGGILEPRLFAFLAVFSGFWAMFYQLYDLLPNFIDDWVDSSAVYRAFFVPLFSVLGRTPPEEWHGNVPQEMMINLNAGMIMLLVSIVGLVAGRLRSMENMILGIVISAAGILLLDARSGWVILAAIAVFSVGEMFASPTKMRYVADMATPDKKALYLGYVNATVGIGWTIGSWIAGELYERTGDKVALGRRYLVDELHVDAAVVAKLPKTDVIPTLVEKLGTNAADVADKLWHWQAESPATVWWRFAAIGLVSMLGMVVFDQITRRANAAMDAAKGPPVAPAAAPDAPVPPVTPDASTTIATPAAVPPVAPSPPAWEEPALIALVTVVGLLSYGLPYAVAFPALMLIRLAVERVLKPPAPWIPGAVAVAVVGAVAIAWKIVHAAM